MNHMIQSFYTKLKETLEYTTHTIKDKMADLLQREKVTVAEIAQMIQHHHDSMINEQTLLGITYRFYHLLVENISFYMETRVVNKVEAQAINDERILFVNIHTTDHSLFTYRAYDDNIKLNEPIKVKNCITNLIKDDTDKNLS